MIKTNLKFALLLALMIWISIKFSDLYSVFGIKPDILLVLLIRRSLQDPRPQISLLWGFGAGLVKDAVIGDVIGISSLVYSVICFFVSYYKRTSVYTPSYKRTLMYIFSVFFSSFLIYTVTDSAVPYFTNFSLIIIPSAIYTMAVSVIFQTLKPTR